MNIFIGDDSITVDGVRYIREEFVTVYAVQHIGNSKMYYFTADDPKVYEGKYVMCDTMYGMAIGKVVAVRDMQRHQIQETGAYFPLKKILREATPEEVIKTYEARQAGVPLPMPF